MNGKRLRAGFLAAAAAALIAAGAAWLLRSSPHQASASFSGPVAVQGAGTIGANPFAKGEYMALAEPQMHAIAADTAVFGIDEKGDLVLDGETRIRLEMLVSALPMNATAHELQTMAASALAGLPRPAVQQASRILEGYVRYFRGEAELSAAFAANSAGAPEDMFNEVIALRRRHLGAQVADALFAAEEMQDRYGLRIAMLEADPKLTAREKLARIDALQRALPDDAVAVNSDLEAARSALEMEQGVAALRKQGASELQVQQLRERHVGAEAAKSIGEMENQKLDWERRRQEFSMQKNAVAQMNLSEQHKQERLEQLLRQIYLEEEIPAARAFHQLHPLK